MDLYIEFPSTPSVDPAVLVTELADAEDIVVLGFGDPTGEGCGAGSEEVPKSSVITPVSESISAYSVMKPRQILEAPTQDMVLIR